MPASNSRTLPDFTADALIDLPLSQAHTIPASWYTSPSFHDFDRDAVFARTWQYAGHVSQIMGAGDHIVAQAAGEPVLVVRDRAGDLRAFHNVCRHRAGPLATAHGCGAKMLTCQYHGWTYTLDGMLRGVPQWDRVDLFDKKDFGLVPIRLAEWEGLLFVNVDGAAPTLEDVMCSIREHIAPVQLGALRFYNRITYPIRCNWKVYVDNYLEGYHVPIVHPELSKVLDYSRYVTETHAHYSLQYSPFRADADNSMYGASATEAFYYFIFPNLMLNLVGGRLQLNFVQPVAEDRCEVIFDNYYADGVSPEQVLADVAYSEQIQRQDEDICERVQIGLNSRAYRSGRFSVQREEAVHHFQSMLRRAYRSAAAVPVNAATQRPVSS